VSDFMKPVTPFEVNFMFHYFDSFIFNVDFLHVKCSVCFIVVFVVLFTCTDFEKQIILF
jgi:hypothetical protein